MNPHGGQKPERRRNSDRGGSLLWQPACGRPLRGRVPACAASGFPALRIPARLCPSGVTFVRNYLAERKGFEPSVEFPPHSLSKARAHILACPIEIERCRVTLNWQWLGASGHSNRFAGFGREPPFEVATQLRFSSTGPSSREPEISHGCNTNLLVSIFRGFLVNGAIRVTRGYTNKLTHHLTKTGPTA